MPYKPTFLILPIIGIFLSLTVPLARANYPDFTTFIDSLNGKDLVTLSATWDGSSFSSTTPVTVEPGATSTISWSIATDPQNANLQNYLSALANGTYTLQLYKGVLGNSSLIASTSIQQGATSSGSLTFPTPAHSGNYFLAYTITYPEGSYPLNVRKCMETDGNRCIFPHYSLDDFTAFATNGMETDPFSYGHPIPALLGLLPFTVQGLGPAASNVLFLPGTMESRLYTRDTLGHEQMLWEPTRNADIPPFALRADGTSAQTIYTRDIVDYLYSPLPLLKSAVAKIARDGAVMYGPFEDFMDSLVTKGAIEAWKAFPYDWRYDVSDIVHDGVLIASTTSSPTRVFLEDVVKQLASDSPTGKVTIIAHSNGGLLAKALAKYLEEQHEVNLLDRIILVGTPQFGTPAAIGTMLHGDGQTRALGIVTSGVTMRTAAATLPGPYDLLPSEAYFAYTATPVVTFASDTTDTSYRAAYGTPIQSYDAFADYLTDSGNVHANASVSDLQTPVALRPDILQRARATHSAIDAWVPPASLALTSITGLGQPTISGYTYTARAHGIHCALKLLTLDCSKEYVLSHTPRMTSQGDDTVVSISAAGNPGTQLYFDSALFEKDSGKHIVHQSLLTASPVQTTITNLLTGASSSNTYVTPHAPTYNIVPSLEVSTHSPVNITVTDVLGRTSGTVAIPEIDFPIIREEIPGSSVQIVDDEKYIYLPSLTDTYSVHVHGYDVGTTTIEIATVNADGSMTLTSSFDDLPTTATTSLSFSITGDTVSPLTSNASIDTANTSTSSETGFTSTSKISGSTSPVSRSSGSHSLTEKDTSDNLLIYYLRLVVTYLTLKLHLVKLHIIPKA